MRRTALFVNVRAALHGEVLTVTHLGRSIRSDAKEKHCIKRADRLLSNRRLQGERTEIYSSLTRLLVGTKQRLVIIVDWSDMAECKRHFLLRASVPVQGRSLTLYEEVHTLKSKEKPKTHQQFLQTLKSLLPPNCRPILVTDAGFRTPWFKQVEALGWDWVGRIRNRHEVQLWAEVTKPINRERCASFVGTSYELPADMVVFGEVGLSGELRPVPNGSERLREAAKHGFRRALVPKANAPRGEMAGLEITAPERLEAALASI